MKIKLASMGIKNNLFKWLTFSMALLLFACNSDDTDPLVLAAEINEVTDALHATFFEFQVEGGTIEQGFKDTRQGLHGIYGLSRADIDNLEGSNLSLFQCVEDIGPSVPQLVRIRTITNDFSTCRTDIGLDYRTDFLALQIRKEEIRGAYLTEFNNGMLTITQVNALLEELMRDFETESLVIKNQYSDTLKNCLNSYMRGFNDIFTREQWVQFRTCIVG